RTNSHRLRSRVQSLILTKQKKFKRRIDLSNHLGINIDTLNKWTKIYLQEGISSLLINNRIGSKPRIIDSSLHNALSIKLQDSKKPLLGYLDAVNWVKENFDKSIKYTTLREYMIRNFKTKLKTPRKSHYKKDEQAIEAFKKTI
ncbi:MAG: winged helix-turn-helix domain-containing protein, partial [Herbaspirillum sp.]|nr:winged helix-turn-helix domain-containing protein [Herbaspirillum sp.]